jgi:hypothetical protein
MVNAEILDNGHLKITTDLEGRAFLQELQNEDPERFGNDDQLHDFLESLITDDVFEWCDPAWAGALTSAPMLAFFGVVEEVPQGADTRFMNIVGRWNNILWYAPVKKCWAFMDYAVRSPLDDLLEDGYCVWQAGQEE